MPLNTGAPLAELATLLELEEETATELDDLLDDETATELDETATELDDLLDEETATELLLATELLVVVPHADAVNCAPFLPTPA